MISSQFGVLVKDFNFYTILLVVIITQSSTILPMISTILVTLNCGILIHQKSYLILKMTGLITQKLNPLSYIFTNLVFPLKIMNTTHCWRISLILLVFLLILLQSMLLMPSNTLLLPKPRDILYKVFNSIPNTLSSNGVSTLTVHRNLLILLPISLVTSFLLPERMDITLNLMKNVIVNYLTTILMFTSRVASLTKSPLFLENKTLEKFITKLLPVVFYIIFYKKVCSLIEIKWEIIYFS